MWKACMGGALLAAGLALPAAAQTLWTFSYTGFEFNGQWDPDRQFTGAFLGDDHDRDGIVERHEIERLVWDGQWYEPVFGRANCGSGYCTLERFSYSLDGSLDFRTDWSYSDEMAYSSYSTISGDRIAFGGMVGNGSPVELTWRWTDQTRFEISPPPVPEPGQYAMLLAGLLAAAGCRMARQQIRLRQPLPAPPSPRPAGGIRQPPAPPHRSPRGA